MSKVTDNTNVQNIFNNENINATLAQQLCSIIKLTIEHEGFGLNGFNYSVVIFISPNHPLSFGRKYSQILPFKLELTDF